MFTVWFFAINWKWISDEKYGLCMFTGTFPHPRLPHSVKKMKRKMFFNRVSEILFSKFSFEAKRDMKWKILTLLSCFRSRHTKCEREFFWVNAFQCLYHVVDRVNIFRITQLKAKKAFHNFTETWGMMTDDKSYGETCKNISFVLLYSDESFRLAGMF